jgi:hypothetical protein
MPRDIPGEQSSVELQDSRSGNNKYFEEDIKAALH